MGIRYPATANRPHQSPAVTEMVTRFLHTRPPGEQWEVISIEGRSFSDPSRYYSGHTLDLDKAWSMLGRLTSPWEGKPTPAHLMFEGDVIQTNGGGHLPFTKSLSPAAVRIVAADLAHYGEAKVDAHFADRDDDRAEDDRAYLEEYLARAQEFMLKLAAERSGMVHTIV